ncbi:hypothetical protein V5N11_035240 [Cardamine amara subsp. amara]|uniref:DUF1985 domain-containing protein n=1 Tax=Cardamine amara subsp. amara TaxID=228776 RepID=A0ABD1BL35_CARAN
MVVLYFLPSMMKTHSKSPEVIEHFLLRIVDNLEECKKFPWGRYTFEDSSHELEHMFERFKGEVRKSWTFPGFIVLLELLAYKAISSLKMEYRKDISAGKDCPRMCKRKFVPNEMSGYPLEDINKALGDSKDICSILEASLDEEIYLMSRIWDR